MEDNHKESCDIWRDSWKDNNWGGEGWQPKPQLLKGRIQNKLQKPQRRNRLKESGMRTPTGWLRLTAQDSEQMTTRVKCICGKTCKNMMGLKICQARMGCLTVQVTIQHTEATSGETQEDPGPETNHSAQSLPVSHTPTASTSRVAPLASNAQNPQAPSAACNLQSH